MGKRTVAISLLGTDRDKRYYERRGVRYPNKWRPNLVLAANQTVPLARLELLVNNTAAEGTEFLRTAAELKEDIESAAPGLDVTIHALPGHNPWAFDAVYSALYGFCRSYRFEPERYEYVAHMTTGTHAHQICLFLLTMARYLPGQLVQTAPPSHVNDPDAGEGISVIDLDLSKYSKLAELFRAEAYGDESFLKEGIATRNPQFNALIARIEEVAVRSKKPILLMGPTGAGKTRLARRIYDLKRAKNLCTGKFVPVNCATIRGDMAKSELFGHVEGAYTGATKRRDGALKAADGGIVFLDEIGALGPEEQAILLKAIEEKTYCPLGTDTTVDSDFQLICSTNADLRAAVADGRFRRDLHARVKFWSFQLLPLRERLEDIEPNVDFELDRASRELGRAVRFERQARDAFLAFARSAEAEWTANFRDLTYAIERMATLATRGVIDVAVVREEIQRLRHDWEQHVGTRIEGDILGSLLPPDTLAAMDAIERYSLAFAVHICRQSRSKAEAARRLFGASLGTQDNPNPTARITNYLKRYGLQWNELDAQMT